MENFAIRFLISNLFVSIIIGILLSAKLIFKKNLSNRMQYNLWFVFLTILVVPFLPIRLVGFLQILSWIENLGSPTTFDNKIITQPTILLNAPDTTNWVNDFTLSVSRKAPSIVWLFLLGIWAVGIFITFILIIKSYLLLHQLKKSSLPLQNREVWKLYTQCLREMNVKKEIPIYSTAFLKSPIIVGLFKPSIYLPIHLISDYNITEMRYMLLHELQHYRYKDALANHLMNLAGVIYWFNPFVWYALKEMRNDREVACDTSVLEMISENEYEAYGNTLIDFAEKVSLLPFPFASGIGGNLKQMKQRILNIASYETPSFRKKLKGIASFSLIALLLISLTPVLSIYACTENHYQWETKNETITSTDLSSYYKGYDGSFVLYDLENNVWEIYNKDYATLRSAPNSTYKIFIALFGLETGIITREQSQMKWNQEIYPFETWNTDQDLNSAMKNSVNWYFQSINSQIGFQTVKKYIQEIGYGNQDINGDFSSYWMESSLKISPIEQVNLLKKLYRNDFGFSTENVQALKDAICLSSSTQGSIYGKTGTGQVNGQNINGWFIGYIELSGHTYFFSTNIQAESDATGSKAYEIALSILSDLQIWN
ncbi:bla regulator protein BlaR1 [Lachnotalea glycerini]|uniref:Bla regulator protein BlaR1 n=1 Tax=Lachnotalea glycerini TaxID=1763509 RepID=A0A318EM23_9FIRM|nr:bla regulator protein BlaR1 [Lachnotalea glycerini]